LSLNSFRSLFPCVLPLCSFALLYPSLNTFQSSFTWPFCNPTNELNLKQLLLGSHIHQLFTFRKHFITLSLYFEYESNVHGPLRGGNLQLSRVLLQYIQATVLIPSNPIYTKKKHLEEDPSRSGRFY
jgi:hypothetical protein